MKRILSLPILAALFAGCTPGTQAAQVIDGPTDAQFTIGSLADGNYRFCSDRLPSDLEGVSGACFRFRKDGEDVVGEFYYPYRGVRICVTGEVNQNTVTGQGVEQFGPTVDPPSDLSSGEEFENWQQDGFLRVGRAQFENTWNNNSYVRYRSALLDLNGFYQFNAGTVLPPETCAIARSDNPAAQIPAPDEVSYQEYVNERFDYRVNYPSDFLSPQEPPTNRDGRTFQSPDGQIVMKVYGSHNALSESLTERYEQALDEHSTIAPNHEITYQTLGDSFFVVSGYRGDWIFYQKTVLADDIFKTLEFSYHQSFQPQFDPIVAEVSDSFETLPNASE